MLRSIDKGNEYRAVPCAKVTDRIFRAIQTNGGIVVARAPSEHIEASRPWTRLQFLAAIVASATEDAIVGKTVDGVITSWNAGAERIFGYTEQEIIGQPTTVLCPPDLISEFAAILGRARQGESVAQGETMRQRKDGTIFPASVSVSPIWSEDGTLIGASSITRDITELREQADRLVAANQNLLDANKNLESFTYSVSHDLRAPLRALSGFSEALLEDYRDVLDEQGREYAQRIRAASEQMATLIDDLLHLSRVARAELHLRSVDLGAEAARVAGELQRYEPDRNVHFIIQRPVRARADRTLIRTVLQNLLGNAWKFTSGRDEASIEFGTRPAGDAAICCYVRDNGAGFDPQYVDKLFTPFQRLHTTREFPGTGVGLASVRQIVERHGGHAWAEGAVGEGATIYFTLDAKETA
jgi:PAS domain S-box-containing protein